MRMRMRRIEAGGADRSVQWEGEEDSSPFCILISCLELGCWDDDAVQGGHARLK
jgi:hypothetical protein